MGQLLLPLTILILENIKAIELRDISKNFGDVVANDNINLSVNYGEILSLLGENGSGKTTLMNILSGIYRPDRGSIFVDGKEVQIKSPVDSKKLGIGMVHQHYNLVDIFSAGDNIWIGEKSSYYGLKEKLSEVFSLKSNSSSSLDKTKLFSRKMGLFFKHIFNCLFEKIKTVFLSKSRYDRVAKISHKFGFDLDPKKKVYNMSVSEKQNVEIIKALYFGAKIIILDEPTAVLTVQEIDKLFEVLKRMKEAGHAIIIITHKLNEVMEISNRVAILRKGKYIGTYETATTTQRELAEQMVGQKLNLELERVSTQFDRPLLEIRNLSVKNDEGALAVKNVSFYIRGGEMLGVAGVAGCGQKELCEAIAGLRLVSEGAMIHKGENIAGLPPKEIIAKGISMSFIPEDRLGMGLAPSLSIADNMILKTYSKDRRTPFVDRKVARVVAAKVVEDLSIITPSIMTPVRKLSGGNVQKVLVGREMQAGPNVIVTAYPVRGLDINSSFAIYDILNKQKKEGVGILFVGEDLDVLIGLCDKIMVLCHGRIMGIVHAHKTNKEELGLMMTGALDLTEKEGKKIGIAKDTNVSEDLS